MQFILTHIASLLQRTELLTLAGADGTLIRRRTPTPEELPEFSRACAQQMKELYENNVTISRTEHEVHRPACRYGEPLSKSEVDKCTKLHQQILATTRKSAASDSFRKTRNFLRRWNHRTIQSFNGIWLVGDGVDREELFGAGGTPRQPEATRVGGKEHHSTYLEMKELYKDSPQPNSAIKVPKVQGIESKHFCCERVFRFKAPYQRHRLVVHRGHEVTGLKSGGKRKVGSKRGHGALEVIIPNQTNTAAVESSQEPNDNSDNDSELEARDLGSDGSELEAGALGSDADMPEFKKGDKVKV